MDHPLKAAIGRRAAILSQINRHIEEMRAAALDYQRLSGQSQAVIEESRELLQRLSQAASDETAGRT